MDSSQREDANVANESKRTNAKKRTVKKEELA